MWRRFKKLPSGPTAIAFTALLVALSGTAVALPGKNSVDSGDIKNGSVRGGDLRANAVTTGKVKNGSLQAADFASGQLPSGAKGDKGDKGDTGAQGDAGTAVAYARIDGGSGNVVAAQSKGVTDAMVDRDATGTYCFSSVPTGTKNIIVTVNSIGLNNTAADRVAMVGQALGGSPNFTGCSAPSDFVRITTYDVSLAALADQDFHIWFED